MTTSELTPAAVWLYARSVEIEVEVEDMIADGMTTKELLAWSARLRHDDVDLVAARERKTNRAAGTCGCR